MNHLLFLKAFAHQEVYNAVILSSTCSDGLLTGKPMFLTWNRIDYNTYLLQLPNKSTAHLFSLAVLQQTSFIV